jgi:hypothetical protein
MHDVIEAVGATFVLLLWFVVLFYILPILFAGAVQ